MSCLLNFITPASHMPTCFTDVLTSFTLACLFHACLPFSHLLICLTSAFLFHTCLPFHTCLRLSHLPTISHLLNSLTSAFLFHICLPFSHQLLCFTPAYHFYTCLPVSHLLYHFKPAYHFTPAYLFHTCPQWSRGDICTGRWWGCTEHRSHSHTARCSNCRVYPGGILRAT